MQQMYVATPGCTTSNAAVSGASPASHTTPLSRMGFLIQLKEQTGQDQQGKDIVNECQGKALKEGCRERR